MKNTIKSLKTYILFWDAILCAVFLLLVLILHLCGLTFRVYIREPITMIIGLSGVVGVFQPLIRLIHKKPLKITLTVIWSILSVLLVGYGFFLFLFMHRCDNGTKVYSDGKSYVEEMESVMWDDEYRYYEDHGPLFRAEKYTYSTDPYENDYDEETEKMFGIY